MCHTVAVLLSTAAHSVTVLTNTDTPHRHAHKPMHKITLLQFPAHEKAEANIDSGNGEPDSTHQKHFSHNDIWFKN